MSKTQKNKPEKTFAFKNPDPSKIAGKVVSPMVVGEEVVSRVAERLADKVTEPVKRAARRGSFEGSRSARDESTLSALKFLVGVLVVAFLTVLVFGMSSRVVAQGGGLASAEEAAHGASACSPTLLPETLPENLPEIFPTTFAEAFPTAFPAARRETRFPHEPLCPSATTRLDFERMHPFLGAESRSSPRLGAPRDADRDIAFPLTRAHRAAIQLACFALEFFYRQTTSGEPDHAPDIAPCPMS